MKRILVTVVILASVGVVGAQEFNLPPGKWWDNERLATHIGLTETQREQIRTQVYEHAHRMIDLNAGVKKAELELEIWWRTPTSSQRPHVRPLPNYRTAAGHWRWNASRCCSLFGGCSPANSGSRSRRSGADTA